jgi:hypothetical protein
MPNAARFLGTDLPHSLHAEPACDAAEICCLCDGPIGQSRSVMQIFETDPTGTPYCAHAKCAHEYGIAMRAFRGAAEGVTPSF